jgi:Na+-driven multidrug efflux pump
LACSLLPHLVIGIYTDIPDLIEASIPSLWVLCSAYIIMIPANIYFQAVSGTGNTRTALLLEFSALTIYMFYMTYIVLVVRNVALCWTTEHIYATFIGLFSYIYMKKGNWKEKKI